MARKHYEWKLRSKPPKIDSHSIAKHKVLEEYIHQYIKILTVRPQTDHFRLFLVDGFSGGGVYTLRSTGETVYGSPVQLLRGAISAIESVNSFRRKKLQPEINAYFIDENRDAINHLKPTIRQTISPYPKYIKERFINDRFENVVGQVCHDIERSRSRNPRAIFVLDQYGYKDVPVQTINNIFRRIKAAEIILTFSVDFLIDYLNNNTALISRIARTLEIAPHEVQYILGQKESDVGRSVIQKELLRILTENVVAEFFTPFFIFSRPSNKAYWLVHLSRHPRARDAMVELHWKLKNHFLHHGNSGLNMLGYDPLKMNQLPFLFDHEASEATYAAILDELPYHIPNEGIQFLDLFTKLCNHTPATQKMISDTLIKLRDFKQIEIRDEHGQTRGRKSRVANTDIVSKPRQIIFPF